MVRLALALVLAQWSSGILATAWTLHEVEAHISSYLAHAHIHGLDNSNGTSRVAPVPRSGCATACGFLAHIRPAQLAWPGSTLYGFEEQQYWSQQQSSTLPACRLAPESASDVSLAVLTARVTRCAFAVKGGGHAPSKGASNIQGGLTIDMRAFNQTIVAADRKEVSVGAGNVWVSVYEALKPMGLGVIGGRVSGIGVGGLTLGGGISYFSNRYGWACDNVNSYEVVLADGSIRQVSHQSNSSDLYWALRGGGNNFGIVTRFDLAAFPQGDLWGGSQFFNNTQETSAAINEAFVQFAAQSNSDPYAQVITSYVYSQALGGYLIAPALQYGRPTPNPPIFRNFTSIPGALNNTLRVTDLPGLTNELSALTPNGFRQSSWTLTVHNSAALMAEIVSIYQDEVEKVADTNGLMATVGFQPLSTEMTKHFTKDGGNALGLAGQGPLILINVLMTWSNAADDARILPCVGSMVDRFRAAAQQMGLDHPFLYQSYASEKQHVFESYGRANLERLRAVSHKYDPKGVWQKLQPGYFKLW
ncbi:hypothetical protein E4U32_003908 [Claviceps aff. humidiphila group G2b]|nr:hypothetical protein E4U32_003908 [Claviceps aff. humidiphila group G2b]